MEFRFSARRHGKAAKCRKLAKRDSAVLVSGNDKEELKGLRLPPLPPWMIEQEMNLSRPWPTWVRKRIKGGRG